MNIRIVRRISQVFFFALFLWFSAVATLGTNWWQLRGWPINWILQLDPLVALGTLLTTHTIYAGLLWALATVVLTIVFGRFFCGWLCPFGSLHQAAGYLGRRFQKFRLRVAANQYRKRQAIKYYILAFILASTAAGFAGAPLLSGFLDPIPFFHRSVNLVLQPFVNGTERFYEGAWLVGVVFFSAVALNLVVPRFYCRFICPLGALLGILGRFSLWRIGKVVGECKGCELCEDNCEGACDPFGKIRTSECLLCMNCLDACASAKMAYQNAPSAAGEIPSPEISRRGFLTAAAAGLATGPLLKVGGGTGPNWSPKVIRPPGALAEEEFLERCIKCGQCMRVCPTNIVQPALLQAGLQGMWTPVLNYRIGTSGCQLNCVACGNVCPTAAIRPLTLEEKRGQGTFAEAGPVRMGVAFFDRSRCLPWAMDMPCIVCQENCPVSPKAITLREVFVPVDGAALRIKEAETGRFLLEGTRMEAGRYGSGDYYCSFGGERRRISANTAESFQFAERWSLPPAPGNSVTLEVRLQRPQIEPEHCIGCGICEHECPVSGLRAVRVSAENETRNRRHSMTL